MAKYVVKLPDGTELTALGSFTLKRILNDAQDISLGSACAAMVEFLLYDATVEAGTELSCYQGEELLGIFRCEAPRRTGLHTVSVTAYDRMIRFDRDIAPWLDGISYPTTAQALLEDLCAHCGVELEDTTLPAMEIPAFSAQGVTGRMLLQWLGEAAGIYFAITPEGRLHGGWYESTVTPLTSYRMGSLTWAQTPTAPIQRVLIRATQNDVGTSYPPDLTEEVNTYILQGNPLLTGDVTAIAQRLYERLKDYTCTPFSCALLPGCDLKPGMRISFEDSEGNTYTAPIMELSLQSGQRTIRATGTESLQSVVAFNRATLETLPERMLTAEATAQGLRLENADIRGNAAALSLQLEGITGRVTQLEDGTEETSRLSALEQKADSLTISITELRSQADTKADKEQVTELTEHFLFNAEGMTISNTATGMGIQVSQRQVAFIGGSDPTTVITPNAMQTTNLHVLTRLDVGGFSLIPRTNRNLSLRYTA